MRVGSTDPSSFAVMLALFLLRRGAAVTAGFGPATSGLTGRRSNQAELRLLAPPEGFEPSITWLTATCSAELSYEGKIHEVHGPDLQPVR
jgi:hypothetical protein